MNGTGKAISMPGATTLTGRLGLIASTLTTALCAACLPGTSAADEVDFEVRRDQVYARRASGELKGDLYLPAAGEPVPGVVMIHGGGWRSGDAGDMDKFAKRVATAGFAVFNITYRLAPEHKFPAQLRDVRDAVRWLRGEAARFRVDPERIGAWGYSAGAHLAMLLGSLDDGAVPDGGSDAASARVSAVVAGAGPTDLRAYPDNKYVAALMPEDAGDELFALASPVAAVSSDDARMFLYHGKRDWIVGYQNSVNMLQALHAAGVEACLYETSFGHIFTYLFASGAVDAGIDFLRTHLRGDPG